MEGSALLQQALSEYLVLVQAGDNTATRSKHGGPVRDCCYVKIGTYVSVGHLLVESAVPQDQPREVRVCPGDVTDKMSLSSLIPPPSLAFSRSLSVCLSLCLFLLCLLCCVHHPLLLYLCICVLYVCIQLLTIFVCSYAVINISSITVLLLPPPP